MVPSVMYARKNYTHPWWQVQRSRSVAAREVGSHVIEGYNSSEKANFLHVCVSGCANERATKRLASAVDQKGENSSNAVGG